MSKFSDVFSKHMINLDTGEPYTDEEWEVRDAMISADRERDAFEKKNEAWLRIKASLVKSGLAERHLGELYGKGIRETPAMKKIDGISEDGVYVMSGNVGCGKTLAAHAWIIGYRKDVKPKPLNWDYRNIRLITSAWFARASRYESEKFEQCDSVSKLVIDDVGVEYADSKKSFLVDLDELLDTRWKSGLTTLLTTNLPAEEFKERYGGRIYDRSRGGNRWMNVKHESMRGV